MSALFFPRRAFFLACFCSMAGGLWAQEQQETLYLGKVSPLANYADAKRLSEALNDLVPGSMVSFDLPTGQFHWLVAAPVNTASLHAFLAPYGLALTALKNETTGMVETKDPLNSDQGLPQFKDTDH